MRRYCPTHGIVTQDHHCGRWHQGSTRAWRNQRKRILDRDQHTCTTHDCTARATEVHHLPDGTHNVVTTDNMLRSVCFDHNPRGGGGQARATTERTPRISSREIPRGLA